MSATVAATRLVVLFVLKPYNYKANYMEENEESLVIDGETIVQYPPRVPQSSKSPGEGHILPRADIHNPEMRDAH